MIANAYRTLMILHLALMGSLGIYGVIVYQATQANAPKDLDPIFLYALGGVALMETVAIPLLRKKLLPPQREATSLDEAVPEDDKVQTALARVFTTSILTWALCESIGIYGLMLSFLSFQPRYFLGFGALALINFLLYRPKRELLVEAARAAG